MPDTDRIAEAIEQFSNIASERFEQIEARLDSINPRASSMGRQAEPDDMHGAAQRTSTQRPRSTGAQVLGSPGRNHSAGGFQHFGEFLMAARAAGTQGGSVDERLMAAAASTIATESSGADGGFAVPPDYRREIMAKAFGEDSLLARTMQITTASNSLTVPSTMVTPWGTDGILPYWESEAAAITQSRPSLENVTIRLHKLAALTPVSDELLEDAPALGALVAKEAGEKIQFKLSHAIAWGTGAGQPLGYMNAPALVTQTAETSQVADTIVAANVTKMASRLPIQSRTNAVWLIHPDAEHQLPLMTIGDQPVYMPPGGLRDSPFGRLLGRPVIPHQVCETLGDLGDVMLVDLGMYMTAVKAGGLRADTSIHLWFDQSLTAFRFIVRVAGQPWWSQATTSRDGSFTQSPFVTLAART